MRLRWFSDIHMEGESIMQHILTHEYKDKVS